MSEFAQRFFQKISPNRYKVKRNIESKPSFLMTNKIGGYISLSETPVSRFQGAYFCLDSELFKVIETIKLYDAPAMSNVTKKFYMIERNYAKLKESLFMPVGYNSISYELSEQKDFELILDVRKSYDTRNFGKTYQFSEEKGKYIIKFTKTKDEQEDECPCSEEHTLFIVLNSPKMQCTPTEKWTLHEYEYDKQRNSNPHEYYVFSALRVNADQLVISVSKDKETAIQESEYVLKNLSALKKIQEANVGTVVCAHQKKINDPEIAAAYKCSLHAIDSLSMDISGRKGVYAGLWWFFQYWSRDEAICLKSRLLQKQNTEVKKIIFRQLDQIGKDGLMGNKYPLQDYKSADAAGWTFKRIQDLLYMDEFYTKELETIYSKLKACTDQLLLSHTHEKIALSGPKETWMDSIQRDGARVEISALRLNMYQLLSEISTKLGKHNEALKYSKIEQETLAEVRKHFLLNSYLLDGIEDISVRPNIFIANYIYPNLLSREEWMNCFDIILSKLFCEWGGLSTLEKDSPEFVANHTGEDPKSYHNGDSWYYLNLLAANCLAKIDRKKYGSYINAILKASTQEILYSGIIGYHAELSSASEQRSEGCLAQAWSSAMYIELIDELFEDA